MSPTTTPDITIEVHLDQDAWAGRPAPTTPGPA